MHVILQGSLRHFPPAELLRFLSANRHSGTLDLQSEGGPRARLFLRDGSVIHGEAADAADVAGVVAQALGFDEGKFALVDEVVLPDGVVPQPAEMDALLEAAAKRIAESATFPDSALFRVVDDMQPQISISADEFKLVLRIGTGRTFGELLADKGPSREEMATLLRAMEEHRLIVRVEAAERTPVEAVPAQTLPQAAEPQPKRKRRGAALTSSEGEAHVLVDDSYSIGRDAGSNSIAVVDNSISTHHARLTREGDSFAIHDLGSRNGTFVNGEQVTSTRLLVDNDEVRLGRVIFTFNIANELIPGETTERGVSRRQTRN